MPEPKKKCTRCKIVQSSDNFYQLKGMYSRNGSAKSRVFNKSKRYFICKECTKLRVRTRSLDLRVRCRNALRSSMKSGISGRYSPCISRIDELVFAFAGECHSCGNKEDRSTLVTTLNMDHCHTTGRFRGWLCHGCNNILGVAKDNISLLEKLIGYLSK